MASRMDPDGSAVKRGVFCERDWRVRDAESAVVDLDEMHPGVKWFTPVAPAPEIAYGI